MILSADVVGCSRLAALFFALVPFLAACWPGPAYEPPRLVLVYATCTLNKDFLAPYDEAVAYTPHLRAFAREALVFERHQTEAGQSSISFASLFSGTDAARHGVYSAPARLPESVPLLAEAFRDAGYRTYAWLEHPMASQALGYARGAAEGRAFDGKLTAESPVLRAALERLRSDERERAFLLTNFTVTHGPYQGRHVEEFCRVFAGQCAALRAPDARRLERLYRENFLALSYDEARTLERLGLSPDDRRQLSRVIEVLYKANVYHLDRLFGAVVDEIRAAGLLDQSAIVFTADHGEVLGRENARFRWTHSLYLPPEVLNVPLLIRAPGAGVQPGRYDAVTRSVDVFPTLASLAEIPLERLGLAGVDLAPAMRREAPEPSLLAFSHTALVPVPVLEMAQNWPPILAAFPRRDPELIWVSMRSGDLVFKLQSYDGRDFREEVYDLSRAPLEGENLFNAADPEQRTALARLHAYKAELVDAYRSVDDEGLDDERKAELLRSLGYIE